MNSNHFFKFLLFLSITLLCLTKICAQEIEINCKNKPLSEVLIGLRDSYSVEFSFNHELLSTCIISKSEKFNNIDNAIRSLIEECNLDIEYTGETYIIFQKTYKTPEKPTPPPIYYFSGQIVDKISSEPLPFSSIQTSSRSFITDVDGNFHFKSDSSIQEIEISYLGYYLLDTLLLPGSNQQIGLTPSLVGLEEIIVFSEAQVANTQIGESPGLVKLNHKVATLLPGNNNNTLFNLLRLQPGILASAEQSGDYIIRGSYRGQNHLTFDGITLFNSTSLNNEIGVVNPMILKDIEVFKGGYNVDKGDRVGNIIQMTGNSGNKDDFFGNININSQTLSGILNIPIANRYSLQTSFRQSYYSIFNWNEITNTESNLQNRYYIPDYKFRDINVKFSGHTETGDNFYFSFLGNNDNSSFNVPDTSRPRNRSWENNINKHQYGAAAFYNKNWKKAGGSNITVSYSSLKSASTDKIYNSNRPNLQNRQSTDYFRENQIEEASVKIKHQFPVTGVHDLNIGGNLIQNKIRLFENFEDEVQSDYNNLLSRISIYTLDKISLGRFVTFKPGVKFDYLLRLGSSIIQPRLSLKISPNEKWNINMAWGRYNQYITEVASIDELNNYYYYWGLSDDSDFSVIEGEHNILGFSYRLNSLIFNLEGFYKTTRNMSLIIRDSGINRERKSKVYGVDIYLKKDFGKHNLWIAYTLSEVLEKIQDLPNNNYEDAAQSQTHELKSAGIFNFNPWYLSLNYVYGSGLYNQRINDELKPYNRLDIAFLYKFNTRKINLETGISIVNIFNSDNISYSGFSNLPGGERIYSKGIPFTPGIFINIGF